LQPVSREVYVKPVFEPEIDHLKGTPEPGRYDNEKREVPVEDIETLYPHGEQVVNKKYVGPPEDKVCKVLKGFNFLDEKVITGKMKQDYEQ
jgi:hypothetical protein